MPLKKYLIDTTNPFSRFLARALDYAFFYSLLILPLFFTSLLDYDLTHFICMSLLPLFWIPLEAFLISFVGTTPGKFLFGIHIEDRFQKKLSLKESFKRAFLVWSKGMGFNLPIFNLFSAFRSFQSIDKRGIAPFDEQLGIHFYQKKNRRFSTAIASVLIVFFSLFFVAEYQFREVITSSNQEVFSTQFLKKPSDLNWFSYKDPEGNFMLNFPGKPKEAFKQLPIPKSKDSLPFYTVHYLLEEDNIEYNLNYTVLPKNWLRWKPALLLKGALKLIAAQISGAKIMKKSSQFYENQPALEFILQKKDNRLCAGRLILVDDVLYKIEVTYPADKEDQVQEHLSNFLYSFHSNR